MGVTSASLGISGCRSFPRPCNHKLGSFAGDQVTPWPVWVSSEALSPRRRSMASLGISGHKPPQPGTIVGVSRQCADCGVQIPPLPPCNVPATPRSLSRVACNGSRPRVDEAKERHSHEAQETAPSSYHGCGGRACKLQNCSQVLTTRACVANPETTAGSGDSKPKPR
jgi:hypothetical protein